MVPVFVLAMSQTNRSHVPQRQPINLIRRRFRAALALRDGSIEDLARQANVSTRHLHFVLGGQRLPSPLLLGTIRHALGDPGWAFATGQADTLCDDAAGTAAATASEGSPCR